MASTWLDRPAVARLRSAAFTLLANRLPLWLFMWWSLLMVAVPADIVQQERPGNLFLDGWFRWDAHFYLKIAAHAYTDVPDAFLHRDTHFWPLFPLLMRGVSYLVPGRDLLVAAFVLNHALLLGSIALMDDLAVRVVGPRAAPLATLLLLLYPFAFYYSAGYTESCFLFFALLTFHMGHRKRWLWAGLAAGLASGTRLAGIAVPASLAVLYLEQHEWSLRKIRPDVLFLALGALGPLAYMAYLQIAFHDPLGFMAWTVGKDWGADVTWARFASTMGHLLRPSTWPLTWIEATDCFHVLSFVAAAVLTLVGARRLRPHLTVFCVLSLLVLARAWTNAGRYCAPLFPTYLVAASLLESRPKWRMLALTFCVLFLALFAFMYGHSYWVS
jgi:Gpi18-like mannosyltransferase